MAYKVQVGHTGLGTGTEYQVGDLLKAEDFHEALLNTNNQYHIAFVVEIDETPAEETSLEDLKVGELKELAEERGIEIPNHAKKADIIDLLNK